MSSGVIAIRYARALARLTGHDFGKTRPFTESFRSVASLFSHKDAEKILKSPVMPEDLKKSLLDHALEAAEAPELMKRFVATVLDQGREPLLPEIGEAFEQLIREANGKYRAQVTSATPLNAEEESVMGRELSALFNKEIDVESDVDQNLLGGFVVKVGHSQLDLSLKSKLDALTSNAAL